ncbi:MAG: PID-CTERM protein-sorting domain-containing protein [Bacteroidia bacterium]
MKKLVVLGLMITALVCLSQLSMAQPPPPVNPSAVPIDGGLGLLLAAGAGLGAKKAWQARKKLD